MIYVEKNFYNLTNKTIDVIKEKGDKSTIVFSEDRNTLALERALCEKTGGSFFCDVTTLNRFYLKLNDKKDVCTKVASSLILKQIILNNKEKLKCFAYSSALSLAKSLFELISQLKSAKVTPEKLLECSGKFDGLFANKLHDVAFCYSEYEKFLSEKNLYDGNNYLDGFVESLKTFPLEDYCVIISGYDSVTKQTAQIFKEISLRAKSVDFIVLGGREEVYVNEMADFAKSLKQDLVCSPELPLTEYLFSEGKKVGLYSDKVAIKEYGNEVEEINSVCEKIRLKVNNGAKYSDFLYVAGNFSSAKLMIKKAFDDYNIPYYFEDKFVLSEHPLLKALSVFLDAVYYKGDLRRYKRFLRFSAILDKTASDEYLSFVEKNAYTEKTIAFPFTEKDEKIEEYEKIRQKGSIVYSCAQSGTVKYFCDKIREIFSVFSTQGNCEKIAEIFSMEGEEELAEFCVTGQEKIEELLNELEIFSTNEKISAIEFKSLLLSGAESSEITVLPQTSECVYVGSYAECKFRFAKNLFATALTSTVLSPVNDTCIFTDSDLRRLDALSVEIDPKIEIVNRRQKEALCVALTEFTNSAEYSYSVTDLNGGMNMPSEIIANIENCYDVKTVKVGLFNELLLSQGDEKLKKDYYCSKFLTEKTGLKNFAIQAERFRFFQGDSFGFSSFYEALKGEKKEAKLDKILREVNSEIVVCEKTAGDLFFKDGFVSATTLEQYFSCPYKNYVSNGLKLKEVQDGTVKPNDLGSVLHEVLQNFIKIAFGDDNENKQEFTDNQIEIIVNQLIDTLLLDENYSKYLKKVQYKLTFSLLRQEAVKYCKRVYASFKNSEFRPLYTEKSFGFEKDKFKAIDLPAKSGKYKVKGIIDRIDVDKENNARIIDYKSGKTSVKTDGGETNFEDESLLYKGKKMQLYLYMNVLKDNNYSVSGVYYAPVNDNYLKAGDKLSPILQGKTVYDEKIIKNTDANIFEKLDSDVLSVKFSNDKVVKKNKDFLDKQTLLDCGEYAKILSGKAVDEIKKGVIIASPSGSDCEHCQYKGLCTFDKEKRDTTRRIRKVSGENISVIVEKENENGKD